MQTTKMSVFAWYLTAMFCFGMVSAQAASITNNDTGGNLSVGTSWIGGVAPGSGDIAVWDSTITAANPAFATSALGANTNWAGLKILNPAVPIVISAGNTLSLGASGLDMSLATANLTLNNPVALIANQSWLVTNGTTLSVNGIISGTNVLTLNGGGSGNIVMNAAHTYTGGTVINGGIITMLNSTPFGAAAGVVTNLGGDTIFFGAAGAGLTLPNPLIFSNTTVIDMNVANASTGNNTWTLPMSGNGTIIITNLEGMVTNDAASIETLTLGSGAAGQFMNNFSGKIIFASVNSAGNPSGGNLRFNGGGTTINVGSPTASFNLGGGYVAFTVRAGGTINLGELTGGPYCSLYSSRSTAASLTTWVIGGIEHLHNILRASQKLHRNRGDRIIYRSNQGWHRHVDVERHEHLYRYHDLQRRCLERGDCGGSGQRIWTVRRTDYHYRQHAVRRRHLAILQRKSI